MTHLYRWVAYLVAGWAGFFGMALEMLGARVLAPYFGNGVYVWGAVITTFMLGLSIGYLAGGHLSTRDATLRRLGMLLIFATVAATPLLLNPTAMLDVIFENISDPRLSALIASMLLFFLPSLALGTISPYCVRLIVDTLSTSGQSAGKLYFVSTLGSTLGTLITSFYLVLMFELNQMLVGLTAITFAIGLVAVLLDKTSSQATENTAKA
jgi:MFS family permease